MFCWPLVIVIAGVAGAVASRSEKRPAITVAVIRRTRPPSARMIAESIASISARALGEM
jgi:hypothetical protein